MDRTFLLYVMVGVTLTCNATSESCLPCACQHDKQYGGYEAVCSNLNLTFVPRNLTENTRVLLLDRNAIQWIPNKGFIWMKKLVKLDLSRNRIYALHNDAFYGLSKLKYLNLDYNKILATCDRVFQPKFLSPLRNLISLSMVKQKRDCYIIVSDYMYVGIPFPTRMKHMYIDCQLCFFYNAYDVFLHLSLLSFSNENDHGYCYIRDITSSTFQYFPHLETLNMSNCQISSIHPKAFLTLKNIRVFDMSVFPFDGHDFDAFMNATVSLQNSPIQTIKFKNRKMTEMKENIFMFLSNTSLVDLYFSSDLHALVKPNTFKRLPVTLKKLTFKNFQFATTHVLDDLEGHQSLSTLDMSGMVVPNDNACSLDIFPSQITTLTCINCRCSDILRWAPQDSELPTLIVTKKRYVRKLILNKSGLEYVRLLKRYTESLEYVDLSDNNLKAIYPDYTLTNNYRISHLNLAKNNLDHYLGTEYRKLFQKLRNLKILDISENNIFSLSNDIFKYFQNIQVINVSNNNLQTAEIGLRGLEHLQTLDLSYNKLHELTVITRTDMELLPNATIRLKGNPLVCSCDEMDFLKWVQRKPDRVQDLWSLSCRFSSGRTETFENIDKIISDLEQICKSTILEVSVSICVAVCALAALAGFLGYRNRWKLRYLYYVGRRGYRRRYDVNNDNDKAYDYHAFVSYADEDRRFVIDGMIPELEEKCGLNLCIHHRDFLPGEVIADNIVNAIQNSRKTLIILSPSFLKSTWCEFEYNMARMEGVSRREEIVLVVLYKDVPMKVLPKDMAVMLRRNCYIKYNNDVFDDEVFWYNVLESIKLKRPVD